MERCVHYHYDKFPPNESELDWTKIIPLIGPASRALAKYDGTLSVVPNAGVLLTPLSTQEAVLSSRIEGTQATMGEVLEFEAEGDSTEITNERKEDIFEILNYRKAMMRAISLLNELPLCQRVIKEAHSVLLKGVRGNGKLSGEYRKVPNWIGNPGCTIEEAKFVPISTDKLERGMDLWERYIHEHTLDHLVQLAILHAEFEALHPFLDGNGRLGRMCVPLFMFKTGLISTPMFYISAYFEANRDEYYERLLAISRDNDWSGWCRFFLKAVFQQAQENQRKASNILELYEKHKIQIAESTHSQYAIHAIDFLFSKPIFKSSDFTNCKEIPPPTAKRILQVLRENKTLEILRESSGRRPATYVFAALLNTAEGRKVF